MIIVDTTIPHQQAQSHVTETLIMLCAIAPIVHMPIAVRPVVPITWSKLAHIQGTSNLPTTLQPSTPIQVFLLKRELSLHPGYAITQNVCSGQFLHLLLMNFSMNELTSSLIFGRHCVTIKLDVHHSGSIINQKQTSFWCGQTIHIFAILNHLHVPLGQWLSMYNLLTIS